MDAMVYNLNHFRSLLPAGTMLAVMVKAFSYGSGAGEIANLLQYQGVNYLIIWSLKSIPFPCSKASTVPSCATGWRNIPYT